MKIARVLLPAVTVGALLLSGCAGGGPTKDAAGESCTAPGAVSDAVQVKGETGTDLTLTSKDLGNVEEPQRTVLVEGKGDAPKEGQNAMIAMSMFIASDSESFNQQPEGAVPFTKDTLNTWAYDGIRCSTPGQQVAMVVPYAEVFGEIPAEQTQIEGLKDGDSVVVVMEFGEPTEGEDNAAASGEPGTLEPDELLKKAEGKAEKAPKGFPTVKLAKDGEPTITIPKGEDAPEKLEIATLIQGDGEEVKSGDRVYVHYRGVIWRTGEEFDSSWSRGEPTAFVTTEVIPGFTKALEGQKVGSQVMAIVPAEDGGYGGEILKQRGHEEDDTMVFVLDILGTVHAE